jgi:hypothetical protein
VNADQLGNQILIVALFIFGGLFGVLFWVMPMLSRRGPGMGIPGALKVKGHRYSYEMGDMLLRFGGASTFTGMDIHLPKRLPHIYLDAYANDHRGRPEFVFDKDDKISLEGDFDEYFQAYAPKQHKSLALSILSPDVLQTFKKTAYKYDIEIMEDHVRLIVFGVPVSRNEQMQGELLKAAKAIMKEVDHRLQSWDESSLTGDTSLDVVGRRGL